MLPWDGGEGKVLAMKTFLISALILGAAAGCGKQEFKDSYQLTENGCSTGKKDFEAESQEELTAKVCATLKDGSQNNNCASTLRKQQFQQKCPGQIW